MQHLDRSAKLPFCGLEVRPVVSYNCTSAGEAMRLIDQEGLVGGDFILLSCDTITNMDVAAAMDAHKARRCGPARRRSLLRSLLRPGHRCVCLRSLTARTKCETAGAARRTSRRS